MWPQGARRLGRWLPTLIFGLSVLFYVAMAPFGYAFFALAGLSPFPRAEVKARFLQAVVRRAFAGLHAYLRWIGFLDYMPRDPCPRDLGACVVIANHPALTDTLAILASVQSTCTAVRVDLYEKYWLKPLLQGCGHFSAGSQNPLSVLGVVQESVERLAQGFRVLLFPEGTRSPPEGGLHRFGRSAFSAACSANVPVVALLIREHPVWLGRGSSLTVPREGTAIKTVELLKVVQPGDFFGDSRQMRDYVEALYRQALGFAPQPAKDAEFYSGANDNAPILKAIGE